MTGRLVDMAFTLGGKQRVTLEINGDFREIWDKLHQEPVLDVEIKKHREKRSLSANAYFHVLCNKISAETGESEDAVKRRLVVSYGALARDKDGKPVGLKLPPTVDPSDFYPYVRLYETRQENGKDYSCYFVYKESHKMDSKEFARLVDGAIEEAKELGIQTDTRNSWLVTKKNGQNDRKGKIMNTYGARPEVIAIPVDEYKELLAANTELKIIYHKLESCTITTEKYTFHEFVQNMHDALHSVELDAEAPAPVIPGMVEPLAAMHAQGAERLTDAEQL